MKVAGSKRLLPTCHSHEYILVPSYQDERSPSLEKRRELKQLAKHIQHAVKLIDKNSLILINELEDRSPGHRFGADKFDHMVELLQESPLVIQSENLNAVEGLLYQLIARAHDIGRHKEALLQLDTLRPGKRHGWLSVECLEEWGVLSLFPEEIANDIRFAVIYHAEKDVPAIHSERAWKLCYLIRDHDKLELIENQKYLSLDGIAAQLALHYFTDIPESELANELEPILNALGKVATPLTGNSVESVIRGGISESAISRFESQELLPLADIRDSYPAYMLYQIAFVFDIQSDAVLERACTSAGFEQRLEFLKKSLQKEDLELILTSLERYISKRIELGSRLKALCG